MRGPEPPALGGQHRERATLTMVPWHGLWQGVPGAPAPARPTRILFTGVRAGHGGTQSGVTNLIRHLDPEEFAVRILTGADDRGNDDLARYAEVFHCPNQQPPGLCRDMTHIEWVNRFVRRHIWSWRPHLIFSWSGPLEPLVATGVPVLTRVRALDGLQPEAIPKGVFAYRVSEHCPGDWPVIVPGVEVTPPPDESKRIPKHVVRIGRADPDRHPDVFADALALMEDEFAAGMTVTVVGDAFYGDWRWDDELAARGLRERVHVAGTLPHEAAMQILETAAVHVANAPESFGQATAEAMMRGVVPVVASDGFGPEMVGQYGIVARNEPTALAEAIRDALEMSRAIWPRHHARTRAIRLYNSERSAAANIKLFRQLTTFPKVDIILPVHNHRAVTQQCVNSILGNTFYGNWHLWIVDDASDDDTVEWLHQLLGYDERVSVICNREQRGGILSAMRAVERTDGEYVMLLNNDMLVPPGWLGRLLDAITDYDDVGLIIPVLSEDPPELRAQMDGIALDAGHRSVGLWDRRALYAPDEDLAVLQVGADNSMVEKMRAHGWRRAMHLGVELYHIGGLVRGDLPEEQLVRGNRLWCGRYSPTYGRDGEIVEAQVVAE